MDNVYTKLVVKILDGLGNEALCPFTRVGFHLLASENPNTGLRAAGIDLNNLFFKTFMRECGDLTFSFDYPQTVLNLNQSGRGFGKYRFARETLLLLMAAVYHSRISPDNPIFYGRGEKANCLDISPYWYRKDTKDRVKNLFFAEEKAKTFFSNLEQNFSRDEKELFQKPSEGYYFIFCEESEDFVAFCIDTPAIRWLVCNGSKLVEFEFNQFCFPEMVLKALQVLRLAVLGDQKNFPSDFKRMGNVSTKLSDIEIKTIPIVGFY